jgi:hypothetical protein
MKLLISGEGTRDLGACNNAQGQCSDGDFNRGPMAVWLARLWEGLLDYNLMDIPEAVVYVSEQALSQKAKHAPQRMKRQRGKKQETETGLFFSNAQHLGLMAQQLAADTEAPVMAVLFRDADGTRSAPGQMWQTKWKSIVDGFASVAFELGVPMLPKPKSEAWLLCAGQTALHSHAAFESISGNDDSPNSAKKRWDAFMGSTQTAAQEVDWCANNPAYWKNLLTMPSFKAFHDRFHQVANAILHTTKAAL